MKISKDKKKKEKHSKDFVKARIYTYIGSVIIIIYTLFIIFFYATKPQPDIIIPILSMLGVAWIIEKVLERLGAI